MLSTVGLRRQASGIRRGAPHLEPPLSERACRAAAAAMTPSVAGTALAEITGMRLFDDQLHQGIPAEVARELPRRGLVDPHERSLDREAPVHAEREGDLRRLDRVVAAIGV